MKRVFSCVVFTIILLISCCSTGFLVGQSKSSELSIEVRQEQTTENTPRFAVSLFNRAHTPVFLLLGSTIGGQNYASSIAFLLKDPSGQTRQLVLNEPAIAGALSLFTVTIAPNERFQLRSINLADYWSYQPSVQAINVSPGRYSLTAIFQGREPSAEFGTNQPRQNAWIGDLSSAPIDVAVRSTIKAR